MRTYFSLAIFWLLPHLCLSQSFNTVSHQVNPNKVSIHLFTQEEPQPKVVIDTVFANRSIETEPEKQPPSISFQARLPLNQIALTSPFGYRTHPVTGEQNKFHSGVDLASSRDTVFSILHGVVEKSGYSVLLGNYVIVKHGEYTSTYGHLSTRFVLTDQPVKAGSPLGITGSTGRVTGEHLHFTVKHRNKYINPLLFLANISRINGSALLSALNNKSNINF